MIKKGQDNAYMSYVTVLNNNLVGLTVIKKEARRISCDQVLADPFLLSADDKRYRILKIKLHNAYLLGNDNALLTVVETKRVLTNYTVPFYLANNPDVSKEVDGVGIITPSR